MKGYFLSIIICAAVCYIALSLAPEGNVKRAVNLACALAMIISVLSPLGKLDFSAYAMAVSEYKQAAQTIADDGSKNSKNLNRRYIEDNLSAYILDKAEKINVEIDCVTVSTEWSSDGYWYPVKCEIYRKGGSVKALSDLIESELGISKENQVWYDSDE